MDCSMAASMARNKMADEESIIQLSLGDYNRRYETSIAALKPLQTEVIKSILYQDTIAMLPTGFGKSLTYEILPEICKRKFEKSAFVLVIVPLNVILTQQLNKLGPCATSLQGKTEQILSPDGLERKRWLNGDITFILCHPEQILDNKTVTDLLLTKHFQEDVKSFIVIDEAHCVLEWGVDFRPKYSKLGTLRAVLPNALVLALSATLTVEGQKRVAQSLRMKGFKPIVASPARDNISVAVCKRPPSKSVQQSIEYIIEPVLMELSAKGQDFPLTVVYFSGSQDWLGVSYEMAERFLGDKLYAGSPKLENARVVQFHASLEKHSDKIKTTIFQNLAENPAESPLKLVLATVALGMGADLRYVQRVINVGPPKRLEAYVQQMGRAGRSGEQSIAIMYFNNSDVGRPEVSQTMKDLCRSETQCRRQFINSAFGFTSKSDVRREACCDICNPDIVQPYLHSSAPAVKDTLRNALLAYMGEDSTGKLVALLDTSTIQQIICAPDTFIDTGVLQETFGFDINVASAVAHIISSVQEQNTSV